jgi:hypothetical protein
VEIDAIVAYLSEFGIHVPPAQYEQLVTKMMNKHVLNMQLGQPYMMRRIAEALVELAHNLIAAVETSLVENIEDLEAEPDIVKRILTDDK